MSFFYLYDTFQHWREEGLSLNSLNWTVTTIGFVSCVSQLIGRRSSFEAFLTEITAGLDQQSLRIRTKEAICISFVVYTTGLIKSALYCCHRVSGGRWSYRTVVYTTAFWYPDWIIMTCAFYFVALRLLYSSLQQQLSRVKQCVRSGNLASGAIRVSAKQMRGSCDEFDRLFGIMPFMWFLFGILAAPDTLSEISHFDGNVSELISNLQVFSVPVLVVLLAAAEHSSLVQVVHQIQDLLSRSESLSPGQESLILRDLDSLTQFQFTGLAFFSLDRSFILSYVGTVATFAALIASFARNT